MKSIIILIVLLGLSSLEAQPLNSTQRNITSVELGKDQSTTMTTILSKQAEENGKESRIDHVQIIPSKTNSTSVHKNYESPTLYNHTQSMKGNKTEVRPLGIGTRLSDKLLRILTVLG
ncbi:hypothetical protein ACLKA7_011196 [Drosophila subpalustris]